MSAGMTARQLEAELRSRMDRASSGAAAAGMRIAKRAMALYGCWVDNRALLKAGAEDCDPIFERAVSDLVAEWDWAAANLADTGDEGLFSGGVIVEAVIRDLAYPETHPAEHQAAWDYYSEWYSDHYGDGWPFGTWPARRPSVDDLNAIDFGQMAIREDIDGPVFDRMPDNRTCQGAADASAIARNRLAAWIVTAQEIADDPSIATVRDAQTALASSPAEAAMLAAQLRLARDLVIQVLPMIAFGRGPDPVTWKETARRALWVLDQTGGRESDYTPRTIERVVALAGEGPGLQIGG